MAQPHPLTPAAFRRWLQTLPTGKTAGKRRRYFTCPIARYLTETRGERAGLAAAAAGGRSGGMKPVLILSLFPGIGLLDRAFEEEWPGACLVRGPDLLWGGDVRRFHPPSAVFDGVVGGPPCQLFSPLQRFVEYNGHRRAEDLIPEFERVVREAEPQWFLMENVPAAPEPSIPGYMVRSLLYNNRWAGGVQDRCRRFSFGTRDGRKLDPEVVLLEALDRASCVVAAGGRGGPEGKMGYNTSTYYREAVRLQGLDPDVFALPGFTVKEKVRAVCNGVPLPMGRAVARAVRRAVDDDGP